MVKKTLVIKDMHCTNCAMILEGIEDRLVGIHSVDASYLKSTLVVEYDPDRIDEGLIVKEIERLGYHVG